MAGLLSTIGLYRREKVAFKLHLWAEIFEAFSVGAISLNEFVFIKSLDGPSVLVGVILQVSLIVMLFSVIFNQLIKRTDDKKKLYRISIWATKLPLFLLIFFTSATKGEIFFHYFFIGIYLAYSLTKPLMMPLMNMILRQSYSEKNFGDIYSRVATINKLTVVATVFIIGSLLDFDNYSFRYIYPVTAILSIIGGYIFLRIPYRDKPAENKTTMMKSLAGSISSMTSVIKQNKPYRDFEVGFMFYGLSFMIAWPVMTIFFEDVLHLNYSSVAFYKNQATLLSLIILPFMGRYIGKTDPRKFAIFTFLSLMLFLIFLGITEYWSANFNLMNMTFYYSLLIAHTFLAVFFAMMLLLWNIGSAYFCINDDVSTYQSIHITLTGVRGAFAPLIGVGIYLYIGYFNTFMLAAVFIFISIFYMFYSMKKYPNHR
ncbi:MAG: MFS transporter [Candidatus Delongbacteria bacterium]|nr:MFS transporter [Candidatus Delongbacteria bacterium]